MPTFQYAVCDPQGKKSTGTMQAIDRQEVLSRLAQQSLTPLSLIAQKERRPLWSGVAGKDQAEMYSLLSDLLESGVALIAALDILIDQTSNLRLKPVLEDLRTKVVDGSSLADAMKFHRNIFNDLAISMVHAGEEGGFLEDALKRIAKFTEKQDAMRSKVLGALAYPAFLLVVGSVVVVGMVMFFVPRFAPMFARLREQGELPMATVLLLNTSGLLRDYGLWLAVLLAIIVAGVAHGLRTETGRIWGDGIKLRLGLLGTIYRQLAIARFCRALGTLLTNGVPLLKSLSIAKEATANRILSQAIGKVSENVQAGKSLVEPLAACGQFPREILEMIHVGEQSNRLETLLVDIADKLEDRTERKLDVLVKLIEPALMLVMAVLIGFLVIALLLPVFESSGSLG